MKRRARRLACIRHALWLLLLRMVVHHVHGTSASVLMVHRGRRRSELHLTVMMLLLLLLARAGVVVRRRRHAASAWLHHVPRRRLLLLLAGLLNVVPGRGRHAVVGDDAARVHLLRLVVASGGDDAGLIGRIGAVRAGVAVSDVHC